MAEFWCHRIRRQHTTENNMSKMHVISKMQEEIIEFWGVVLLYKLQWCFLILGDFVCRLEGNLIILFHNMLQGAEWLFILTGEVKYATRILSLSVEEPFWPNDEAPRIIPVLGMDRTLLTVSVFRGWKLLNTLFGIVSKSSLNTGYGPDTDASLKAADINKATVCLWGLWLPNCVT